WQAPILPPIRPPDRSAGLDNVAPEPDRKLTCPTHAAMIYLNPTPTSACKSWAPPRAMQTYANIAICVNIIPSPRGKSCWDTQGKIISSSNQNCGDKSTLAMNNEGEMPRVG